MRPLTPMRPLWGYGGSVTLGRKNGKWFARAAGGVGYGGGFKVYPTGEFPVKSKCGDAAFIGVSGSVGAAVGPISGEIKGEAGLGLTRRPDGRPQPQYIEQGGSKFSLKWKNGWGFSLGGGLNFIDAGLTW